MAQKWNSDNWGHDLDGFVNDAVQMGTEFGSAVFGAAATALEKLQIGKRPLTNEERYLQRRKALDARLRSGKVGWLITSFTMWILALSFGTVGSMMAIVASRMPQGWIVHGDPEVFPILAAVFLPIGAVSAVIGAVGTAKMAQYSRLQRLVQATRGWVTNMISLCERTKLSPKRVEKDLLAAQKGVLSGTFLDEQNGDFYLDADRFAWDEGQEEVPETEPETERNASAAESPADLNLTLRREKAAAINHLNSCKGRLPSPVDEELDEMMRLVESIYDFVLSHPEQVGKLERFRGYYLPTTRTMLDSATGISHIQTQNAETIRRDIGGILHTLNQAYHKLMDSLLEEMTAELSIEIDTLETMLGQDGLTHDFASDFGIKPGV